MTAKPTSLKAVEPDNKVDQHIALTVPITRDHTVVHIRLRDEFGMVYPYTVPATGALSSNLRFISEQWNASHDRLELQIAGRAGAKYRVPLTGDLIGLKVSGGNFCEMCFRSSSHPKHLVHTPPKR